MKDPLSLKKRVMHIWAKCCMRANQPDRVSSNSVTSARSHWIWGHSTYEIWVWARLTYLTCQVSFFMPLLSQHSSYLHGDGPGSRAECRVKCWVFWCSDVLMWSDVLDTECGVSAGDTASPQRSSVATVTLSQHSATSSTDPLHTGQPASHYHHIPRLTKKNWLHALTTI